MEQSAVKLKLVFIITGIFMLTVFCVNAQTTDSLPKTVKEFKNSIKLNVTSPILYSNALSFSYERVLKKNQTLNIFAGYQEFPERVILKLDNANLGDTRKKSGYSFGAEYRFYLAKENKYDAPHGIYVAPFFSFYRFNSQRILTHTDTAGVQSSGNLETQINFLNVGGELGYQFVLWDRFVIDAVMFGPAITKYKFKAALQSDIPGLDENEALQAVIDALKERLPLLNDITKEGGIDKSGTEAFWSAGFRYNISIGFRF